MNYFLGYLGYMVCSNRSKKQTLSLFCLMSGGHTFQGMSYGNKVSFVVGECEYVMWYAC